MPPGLWDKATNSLRYCQASVDYVVRRLEANPDALMDKALRGLEELFEQIFQNLNFCGVSFLTQDLRGMNFSGARFVGANFSRALIEGATFRGAEVSRDALRLAVDWPEAVAWGLGQMLNTSAKSMDAPNLGPWARFSEAHHLPELLLVPSGLQVPNLSPRLRAALREGRLAIGQRPICGIDLRLRERRADVASQMGADWRNVAAGKMKALELVEVDLRTALDYLEQVNSLIGGTAHDCYELPPPHLLWAVAPAAEDLGIDYETLPTEEFTMSAELSPQLAFGTKTAISTDAARTNVKARFRVLRVFAEDWE